jgi:pimeloyl-ACP methyl ester carboxylesterase
VTLLREGRYRIIVPELLGHGKSPAPGYIPYTSDDQAKAVLTLCRRLELGQIILVGHSMGTLVATRLATLQPALVRRLILYEPPLFADMSEFRTHQRRRDFYFDIYERIAKNPSGSFTMTRLLSRISKNWTKFLESQETWIPIERSLRNTIIKQQGYEELRDIAIATDIVHGRFDVVVTRANLKKLLSHNQNVRFYRTTDRHGLSKPSARYLARLIGQVNSGDATKGEK